MVQELINQDIGEWDKAMINDIFVAVNTQAILQIPNGSLQEDLWAWQLERQFYGILCLQSASGN